MPVTPTLSFASVFASDIEKLSTFYADLLGLPEVTELRSEHFRGLRIGPTILGFSAPSAYAMLNLTAPGEGAEGVDTFLTFEMPDAATVDSTTAAAVAAGARCVREPGRTSTAPGSRCSSTQREMHSASTIFPSNPLSTKDPSCPSSTGKSKAVIP